MRHAPRVPILLAALAVSFSCGKKGPVLPPLRPDPQPIADLKLGQQGDTLVVSYQASRDTLDAQPLDVHEVEVLLAERPGDIARVGRVVHKVTVAPGEMRTEAIPLPAVDTDVRVALRSRFKGIRSTPSRVISMSVQPPPAAPASVTAENDPAGVLVHWPTPAATATPTPSPTPSTTATPTAAPSLLAVPTPTPAATGPSGYLVRRRPPIGAATLVTSRPVAAPPFVDESPLTTGRWCYSVSRVLSWEPLVASAHSPEGCVDVKDVRPPQPPAGLTLVASRGGLELSWSPASDTDVAAYRVYRSEEGGEPKVLGELPPVERSFRDTTAVRGTLYQYRVTALDGSGNESALSPPVEASLR